MKALTSGIRTIGGRRNLKIDQTKSLCIPRPGQPAAVPANKSPAFIPGQERWPRIVLAHIPSTSPRTGFTRPTACLVAVDGQGPTRRFQNLRRRFGNLRPIFRNRRRRFADIRRIFRNLRRRFARIATKILKSGWLVGPACRGPFPPPYG